MHAYRIQPTILRCRHYNADMRLPVMYDRPALQPITRHMTLRTFGPAILFTVIGFVIAWQFVNPAPQRHIRSATGSEQGAYYLFAQHYREQLAREGIELEILTTNGSIENL